MSKYQILTAIASVSTSISSGSAGVGASSAALSVLNDNAGAFSIGLGILSVVITCIFGYLGWSIRKKAHDINEEKRRMELLKVTLEVQKLKDEMGIERKQ